MWRVVGVSAGLAVCAATAVVATSVVMALLAAGEHLLAVLAFLLAVGGLAGCAVATLAPILKD